MVIALTFAITGMVTSGVMVGATNQVATPGATPSASPKASPVTRTISVTDKVTIELTDEGFNPSVVQSTNGHDLTITLVNTGSRDHAFQIKRLKVDVSLHPGEHRTLVIASPPLGDFTYVSNAPGDEQWSGTLIFYI